MIPKAKIQKSFSGDRQNHVEDIGKEDFDNTDCLLFFGQSDGGNAAKNASSIQDVRKRNVPIIAFNPYARGAGALSQSAVTIEMLTPESTIKHQVGSFENRRLWHSRMLAPPPIIRNAIR